MHKLQSFKKEILRGEVHGRKNIRLRRMFNRQLAEFKRSRHITQRPLSGGGVEDDILDMKNLRTSMMKIYTKLFKNGDYDEALASARDIEASRKLRLKITKNIEEAEKADKEADEAADEREQWDDPVKISAEKSKRSAEKSKRKLAIGLVYLDLGDIEVLVEEYRAQMGEHTIARLKQNEQKLLTAFVKELNEQRTYFWEQIQAHKKGVDDLEAKEAELFLNEWNQGRNGA